jgi:polar amino acid transport system substrate-binding protein
MRILSILFTALLLLAPAFSFAASNEKAELPKKITIVADEWCPYNCEENSTLQGFMVDIARAIFAKRGIEVEYKVVPWERALDMTKNGTYDGAIAVNIKEGAQLILPKKEQAISKYEFFILDDSKWEFKGIESLKGHSLGCVSGYTYGNLQSYIDANKTDNTVIQEINSDNASTINLKKLLARRVNVVIEDSLVMNSLISSTSNMFNVKSGGFLVDKPDKNTDYTYIGFSPNKPYSKELAQILSDGTIEMEKSGEIDTIMSKYGVHTWNHKNTHSEPSKK